MDSLVKSKGFTLLEILIALTILAVALLALAGLMATTAKNNSSGAHVTEATTFGQDKLEEFRAMNWSAIPLGQGTDPAALEGATKVRYTRNWTVSLNPLNANLKEIVITVSWFDRINHSIRLLSVITR